MMKGMAALSIVIVAALLLTVTAGTADANVLNATGSSTQLASALDAMWGQTTYSWDDDDDDDDDDNRRSARQVRSQAYGELIEIIRLLTGPENWGEVRVVTGESTSREDDYTENW